MSQSTSITDYTTYTSVYLKKKKRKIVQAPFFCCCSKKIGLNDLAVREIMESGVVKEHMLGFYPERIKLSFWNQKKFVYLCGGCVSVCVCMGEGQLNFQPRKKILFIEWQEALEMNWRCQQLQPAYLIFITYYCFSANWQEECWWIWVIITLNELLVKLVKLNILLITSAHLFVRNPRKKRFLIFFFFYIKFVKKIITEFVILITFFLP